MWRQTQKLQPQVGICYLNLGFTFAIYIYIYVYIIICHYISLYIIIYYYISLYIIIYHYISLYIIIYHYISLFIIIYHYIIIYSIVTGTAPIRIIIELGLMAISQVNFQFVQQSSSHHHIRINYNALTVLPCSASLESWAVRGSIPK